MVSKVETAIETFTLETKTHLMPSLPVNILIISRGRFYTMRYQEEVYFIRLLLISDLVETIVFPGDSCQIAPVMKKGGKENIVAASFKCWLQTMRKWNRSRTHRGVLQGSAGKCSVDPAPAEIIHWVKKGGEFLFTGS